MESIKLKGKQAKIFKDRGKRYGHHVEGHRNLGLLWTALLQNHYGAIFSHPIPAHLVETMMVANKLNRIAVNPQGEDHYEDAAIYTAMARDAAEREGLFAPKVANGKDHA